MTITNDEPHYRILDHETDGLVVVCVQSFDIADYDPARLGTVEYATEEEAQADIDLGKLGLIAAQRHSYYGAMEEAKRVYCVRPSQAAHEAVMKTIERYDAFMAEQA